jgi:TonB family protein
MIKVLALASIVLFLASCAGLRTKRSTQANVKPAATPVPMAANGGEPQTVDREAIRRVVQAHLPEIQACYTSGLAQRADDRGKIIVQWDITSDGSVKEAQLKSSELKNPDVGICVVREFAKWKFPKPPENNEITVAYPIFFSR